MPRKRELDRLRERARLDPVFAAEWKAKKLAEDKARRDAKLTPDIRQKESTEALVPDHKHGKPPVPRALLCPGCNSALGLLKDSPERCEAAAAYLRKFLELT
jgi:hypothetical protein